MTPAEIAKALRKASRELFRGMPRGGPSGPPQGKKKLYNRRVKHPKKETDG